jgi:hypothetical protein
MQQVASQNAPSPGVVVPHFVFGGAAWLGAAALIALSPDAFAGHYFSPALLALTHLLVLGWMTMVIFGALYQLIPVIMEVKLFSERLALLAFALLAAGTVLLTVAFWQFRLDTVLYSAATLIVAAVICFAVNVFATARQSAQQSIEKDFILTAIVWLLFTVGAGVAAALNLRFAFIPAPHLEWLKLHAHAGLAGWFLQLIIGVSSRLLPMFMVSHDLNRKKLNLAYYLINGGLLTGIVSLYAGWSSGIAAGVAGVILGVIAYLTYLTEAYRKRVKKQLDIGMRQSALSFLFLLLPLVLACLLVFDLRLAAFDLPIAIAYGAALLLGFITSVIMGQTYKTLPFIIWLKVYRQRAGRGKVPLPRDLYWENGAVAQLWLFAAGFVTLQAGILLRDVQVIQIGGGLLFLSAGLYNFNVLKIVFHKPKLR